MKTLIILLFASLLLTTGRAQKLPDQQIISQTGRAGSANDQSAVDQLTAKNTVEQGARARYTAGQAITLQPGFCAQAGSVFTASIGLAPATYNTTEAGSQLSARAYPNPFQQTTTIEYVLPRTGQVSCTLTDEQGHILRTEIETTRREPGRHETRIKGEGLTEGVYFYQIRVNNEQRTIRLLKTR